MKMKKWFINLHNNNFFFKIINHPPPGFINDCNCEGGSKCQWFLEDSQLLQLLMNQSSPTSPNWVEGQMQALCVFLSSF